MVGIILLSQTKYMENLEDNLVCKLTYRSLKQHPEYKEVLLDKVKSNSGWDFLYDWLLDRFEEMGQSVLPQIYMAFDEQENMTGYYVLCDKEIIRHDSDVKPWLGIILVFDDCRMVLRSLFANGKSYKMLGNVVFTSSFRR